MKFYKSAKVLILRPDILSTTLGMLWALFVVIITIISVASKQTIGLVELFKVIYPFYRSSFSYTDGMFPKSEHFGQNEFSLPLSNDMSLSDAKRAVTQLKKIYCA